MHVNLPEQWKSSSYGVKYFRCDGFDYGIWQKNTVLTKQTMRFPLELGRPASECLYLAGIYGVPDPPLPQAYSKWKQTEIGSLCFCLRSALPEQQACATDCKHRHNVAKRDLPQAAGGAR